jgi:hypothetical protein
MKRAINKVHRPFQEYHFLLDQYKGMFTELAANQGYAQDARLTM